MCRKAMFQKNLFQDQVHICHSVTKVSLFMAPANSLIVSLLIAFKDNGIGREIIKE